MARRSSDLPWLHAMRESRGAAPLAGLRTGGREARSGSPPLSSMDRRVERRWWTRERLIGSAFAGVAFAALAAGYVRYGTARTLTVSAVRVVLSTVRAGDFLEYIPVSGSVEPRETVYLDAVDGGQVAEVYVEEGAFVKAGQPLVKLANAALELQVLNSEAQLSEQLDRLASAKLQFAQSRLTHARELIDATYQADEAAKRLARLNALAGTGVVARADVEDAKLEADRLKGLAAAEVEARDVDESLLRDQVVEIDRLVEGMRRNLTIAKQNLDHLVIRAPFDGQLTQLDAHLGESKATGQRIGQVDRTDGFKVEALIDEHYLQRVTIGEVATTEPDSDTPPARFVVAKVYPQVTERQFKVDLLPHESARASPRTPDPRLRGLRRGETVQLRLDIGGERKGLVLANGPFYDDTGGQWVFVLPRGGNVARRRAVELGRRNVEQVEVLGGLTAGERVIVSSYVTFKGIDRITLTGGAS